MTDKIYQDMNQFNDFTMRDDFEASFLHVYGVDLFPQRIGVDYAFSTSW